MVTMASSAPSNIAHTPLSPDVSTTTVPKKSDRRSNKPIMEKRRRARINNSLNELKTLILDAMKKDPARHSKLEKADILEMAVKHLESLHKQQAAMASFTDKYRAGFNECASEVNRFPGLESTVRKRLVAHLNQCVSSGWISPAPTSANAPSNELAAAAAAAAAVAQQQQQNLHVQILPSSQEHSPAAAAAVVGRHASNGFYLSAGNAQTGVQVVPTRLPNGDLALILPSVSASIHHQQRLSTVVSPTPSSSSSSPPPLTMINHSRSAYTESVTSSQSPIAFERLSVNIPAHSSSSMEDICHSPGSVHSSYSSPRSPGSSVHSHYDSYSRMAYSPKPLSLVVNKEDGDKQCWRPW